MDIFDWEELIAETLDISDEERENHDCLPEKFYDRFSIEFDTAFELAQKLILHTVPVEAGLSKKPYHAFVSLIAPVMLMKIEAKAR